MREEVEGKEILPENETGFRKRLGTINNIFVVNYLMNRQLVKRGGSLVALIVDLKAAFDSIDRGVLVEIMKERGLKRSW